MTKPTLASMLCHRVLIEKLSFADVVLFEHEAAKVPDFNSMGARLGLSNLILGIEKEPVRQKAKAKLWYAAEQMMARTISCSYVESGFLSYMQGDMRRTVDVSQYLVMGKEKLFDRLRAAYLVRWGYFLKEIKGEGIIVCGSDLEQYKNNLSSCGCKEFREKHDCEHLALSRVYLSMKSDFEFLVVGD